MGFAQWDPSHPGTGAHLSWEAPAPDQRVALLSLRNTLPCTDQSCLEKLILLYAVLLHTLSPSPSQPAHVQERA